MTPFTMTTRRTVRDNVRIRKADPVQQALLAFARQVDVDMRARRETVVSLAGYGAGWYITDVDWERRLFTVRRSGEPIDVAWDSVLTPPRASL